MALQSNAGKLRDVIKVNVDLHCDYRCEDCEKFFECTDDKKWEIYKRRRMAKAHETMSKIKHKIAVLAGKGGVGKSTVTANLATALAMKGRRVCVLDHDFDGPCIPKMFGLLGKRLQIGSNGIVPVEALLGMKVVSTGLIMGQDEILTWFHDMRRSATEEFLAHVDYGEQDYLLVDLPPGTSSDTVNLMQYIPDLAGAVLVTVPSEVSQDVARKAALLCIKAGVKVFGVIENMSGTACPRCGEIFYVLQKGGGEKLAEELGVPFFGAIPLDPRLSECADMGVPFVYKYPDTPVAAAYRSVIDNIEKELGWPVQ